MNTKMKSNFKTLPLVVGLIGAVLVSTAFAQTVSGPATTMATSSPSRDAKSGLPLPKGWPMPTDYSDAQELSMARIAYTLDAQKRGDKENYGKAAALIHWYDREKADQDNRRRQYLTKAIDLAGQRAREHGRSYATPAEIQQALNELEARGQ